MGGRREARMPALAAGGLHLVPPEIGRWGGERREGARLKKSQR